MARKNTASIFSGITRSKWFPIAVLLLILAGLPFLIWALGQQTSTQQHAAQEIQCLSLGGHCIPQQFCNSENLKCQGRLQCPSGSQCINARPTPTPRPNPKVCQQSRYTYYWNGKPCGHPAGGACGAIDTKYTVTVTKNTDGVCGAYTCSKKIVPGQCGNVQIKDIKTSVGYACGSDGKVHIIISWQPNYNANDHKFLLSFSNNTTSLQGFTLPSTIRELSSKSFVSDTAIDGNKIKIGNSIFANIADSAINEGVQFLNVNTDNTIVPNACANVRL